MITTIAPSRLQTNGKVKNYCCGCNVHVNGSFCPECGHLVAEEVEEDKLYCHKCQLSGKLSYVFQLSNS